MPKILRALEQMPLLYYYVVPILAYFGSDVNVNTSLGYIKIIYNIDCTICGD